MRVKILFLASVLSFVHLFSFPSPALALTPGYQWTKVTTGGRTYGHRVAVHTDGSAYVAGDYLGTVNFGVGEDTASRVATGATWDAFLSKYDSNGNRIWTKTYGGTGDDGAYSVEVDASGNVYVNGHFETTVDFGAGGDTASRVSGGGKDGYITKYQSDGTRVWTKTFGSTGLDSSQNAATDLNNNVYLTGKFTGTVDFGAGGDTAIRTVVSASDTYITKYQSDGTRVWTKTLDTDGPWVGTDINNNLFLTSSLTGATVDFGAGGDTAVRSSTDDGLHSVTKYQSDGTRVWTKTFGTERTGSTTMYNVAADLSGNIFVLGEFSSTLNFGAGGDTATRDAGLGNDVFISKHASDGSRLWTKTFGGDQITNADGLAIDSDGNIYLAALFSGTTQFNPGAADPVTHTANATWGYNMYIQSYDNSGNYLWTRVSTGGLQSENYGIDVYGGNQSLFTAGVAYGETDFDPQGSHDVINVNVDGSMTLIRFNLSQAASSASNQNPAGSVVCTTPSIPTWPDLFQINSTRDSALLYFAPVPGDTTEYHVVYGLEENTPLYGTKFAQGSSTGVLSHKINLLAPNTAYYFRVVAANGCATSPWSNVLKIITSGKRIFYRYTNK